MNAYKTSIEANIHILEFCADRLFQYNEVQSIRPSNGKIDCSLFIDIKQKHPVPDQYAEIELIHILDTTETSGSDGGALTKQSINAMSLGKIELFKTVDTILAVDEDQPRLIKDTWKFKRTFKWNLKNIPTDGPGLYAIAVVIPAGRDPQEQDILDCSYFKIKEEPSL